MCMAACIRAGMASASAAEVTMTADVLPPAALGSIAPSGSGTTNAPYVYAFSTANGLDMASYSIRNNELADKNVLLDLNGGSITSTAVSGRYGCTNFSFRSTADTYRSSLTITNVNNIRIGKVWTYGSYVNSSVPRAAGNVLIGNNAAGKRAGRVEISEILTYGSGAFGITPPGIINIYGTNDVLIWDGVARGNIERWVAGGSGYYEPNWDLIIWHDGAFLAGYVDNSAYESARVPSSVNFNGDILGDGASGSFQACSISNTVYYLTTAGSVLISNYTSVAIGVIDTHYDKTNPQDDNRGGGGAVTITNIAGSIVIGAIRTYTTGQQGYYDAGNISISSSGGDITVTDVLDLHATNRYASGGILMLSATKANAVITLPDLDLTKMNCAAVSPGSKCIVKGDLIGFSTNTASQTQLRMPAGKRMFYYPDRTNNAYLARGRYLLADTSGVSTNGGVLMPYVSPGTVITLK
ncbi:MAG: hypothetical protein C0404_14675 [Verrucomicrobia bacterium]|nr:hypothetical protein [Verrucomicrobiota bacterium]